MTGELTKGVPFDECRVCERYEAVPITHIAATALVVGRIAAGETVIPSPMVISCGYMTAVNASKRAALQVSTEYFTRVGQPNNTVAYERCIDVAAHLSQVARELDILPTGLYECARNQMLVAVRELGLNDYTEQIPPTAP